MELGQEQGIVEDEVRSYLYTGCKLVPQEVSKVRVLKNKTFISLPENRLKECLKHMRTHPIGSQKAKIYLVKDTYRPHVRKTFDRRSQFRGPRRNPRR